MRAYYNEIDPTAAEWIRELIKAGLVTDGEVDERSIEDVIPADLVGFDRCHFFAGIAVWDYALNLARWPDDRRVWTGSCPCQPFSAAGKGKGFADERHLWPAWFHLIDAYRRSFGYVPTIFGEQVASKDGLTWLDTVQTDLEAIGYATATIDLPVAGVGAPHIRQRLFFVADATNNGHSAADGIREATKSPFTTGTNGEWELAGSGDIGNLADPAGDGSPQRHQKGIGTLGRCEQRGMLEPSGNSSISNLAKSAALGRRGRGDGDTPGNGGQIQTEGRSDAGGVVNTELRRSEQRDTQERGIQEPDAGCSNVNLGHSVEQGLQGHAGNERNGDQPGRIGTDEARPITPTGFTNGFWSGAEWVYCNDPGGAKWRPIEPGTFPLATRTPGRVALLRGYGNSISPWAAKAFIEAYIAAAGGQINREGLD